MTTAKMIEAMAKVAFGNTFHQALREKYQRDTDAGRYAGSEGEYAEAMAALPEILSGEKMGLLAQYEDIATQVWEFHGTFGYLAGLYCGFRQCLTADDESDGGFSHRVVENISQMPRMKQYRENFAHLTELNALFEQLSHGESPETNEHIISLQCGWDQRAHSASVDGFYCGYRAAMEIIDYISPESQCKFRMMGKLLSVEYQLGFTRSYAEQERQSA